MWYLVMRRPVKPREEWTVNLDQHLVWMKQQHDSGRILFSGPTPDKKIGIYVIKGASKIEAEEIAASDPYTAAGFCAYEIYEWDVHQIIGVGPSLPRNCAPIARMFRQLGQRGDCGSCPQKLAKARSRNFDSENVHGPKRSRGLDTAGFCVSPSSSWM